MDDVRTITISLIRHAPTVYPSGTLPPYDPDINLDGYDHSLAQLAEALPKEALWLVSPLSRCAKTANAIIKKGVMPLDMETWPDLEEQRYGDWHGMPVADIWDQVKDGPKSNWHFLHPTVTPPYGESFNDLITRLQPVMQQIISRPDQNIVIVAHAMVIRAMVGQCLGLTAGQSLALGVEPLSLTTLTYMASGCSDDEDAGGAWHLGRLNQCF